MTISELIMKLRAARKEHGDIEVCTFPYNSQLDYRNVVAALNLETGDMAERYVEKHKDDPPVLYLEE